MNPLRGKCILICGKEKVMPFESAIVVTFIASLFCIFAGALAYGEYQTRHFKRPSEDVASGDQREQQWLKAA